MWPGAAVRDELCGVHGTRLRDQCAGVRPGGGVRHARHGDVLDEQADRVRHRHRDRLGGGDGRTGAARLRHTQVARAALGHLCRAHAARRGQLVVRQGVHHLAREPRQARQGSHYHRLHSRLQSTRSHQRRHNNNLRQEEETRRQVRQAQASPRPPPRPAGRLQRVQRGH